VSGTLPTPTREHAGGGPVAARSLSPAMFWLRAAMLVLAVGASCVLATVLATRLPVRLDLTATREHRLSPRTQQTIAALPGPVDLLMALDFSALDRSTRQRLLDVLDKFQRAGEKVRVTTLDTSSAEGAAGFAEVLSRLAQRAEADVRAASGAIKDFADLARQSGERAADIAGRLEGIGQSLGRDDATLAAGPQLRQFFQQQSASFRVLSRDLAAAAEQALRALEDRSEGLPVPAIDSAGGLLRPVLSRMASDLTGLQTNLDAFVRLSGVPDAARQPAVSLSNELPALRDALARESAALAAVRVPGILRVARTLQRQRAALLMADPATPLPPGREAVVALELDRLLPPAAGVPGQPTADTRGAAEELIGAALARFTPAALPMVVLVHGEAERFAPGFGSRTRTMERLATLGFEPVEWAAALDDQPPAAVASAGDRPVLFVTSGVEANNPESAARMGRLANVVAGLVREGRDVLLSVNVSSLPGVGAADPMTEFLEPLGVKADSGRPLMVELPGVRRVVSPDQDLVEPSADHVLSRSLRGVRTYLPWCVPLRVAGALPAGVRVEPVIMVPPGPGVWASSEWLGFRQLPPNQRPLAANPPRRGAPGDDLNTSQPWLIAAAITRARGERDQRVLVVGSEGWYSDGITAARVNADGREVLAAPGNFELLAGGLWWLAGQDERLARGSEAAAVAAMPALTPTQLAALRWVLGAGVPVLVLLAGAAWRLWRG
jgi:hypothetical protein